MTPYIIGRSVDADGTPHLTTAVMVTAVVIRVSGVTEYRGPRSLWLDVSRADHLAPLLGFCGDELAEVGGRTGKDRSAWLAKPCREAWRERYDGDGGAVPSRPTRRPETLESIPRQEATGAGRYAERRMKRRFTFCTGRAFIG